jgi:hypothetical protein
MKLNLSNYTLTYEQFENFAAEFYVKVLSQKMYQSDAVEYFELELSCETAAYCKEFQKILDSTFKKI